MIRPRFAAAVFASMMLIITLRPVAAGASPALNVFQVVQFNIWGNRGGDGYNPDVAAAVIASLMSRDSFPLVISMNEVCRQQFDEISQALVNLGLGSRVVRFQSDSFPSGNQPCGQYGNALFVLSSGGSPVAYQYSAQGQGKEKRNFVCANVSQPTSMVACSTHLVAGNPSVAGQQLAELNAFLEPYRQAGRRIYMMGDFNLDRNQNWWCHWASNTLTTSYSRYGESDSMSNRSTTDGSFGCKYDYTFMGNPVSPIYETDAYIYDSRRVQGVTATP